MRLRDLIEEYHASLPEQDSRKRTGRKVKLRTTQGRTEQR